jgi:hypothetical protein
VLASLLLRCQATGWHVIGASLWKNTRKLRAKGPTPKEEQNVMGLAFEVARVARVARVTARGTLSLNGRHLEEARNLARFARVRQGSKS